MGFSAPTFARPVFPAGTQMREKRAAATIRDAWPITSRQALAEAARSNALSGRGLLALLGVERLRRFIPVLAVKEMNCK